MSLYEVPDMGAPAMDQACAVPYRVHVERVEFCLITSSAGRWQFPKGFVEAGETQAEAALKEALEEAGLHGRVIGEPIGYYKIQKKRRPRNVIALLMEVLRVDDAWPEEDMRLRRWATPEEAYALVSEKALQQLLAAAHATVLGGRADARRT